MLLFRVVGDPVAKERPRRGKGGHFYTPRKTKDYEQRVALAALQALNDTGQTPPLYPKEDVCVQIDIRTTKGWGDIDNVAKSVCDGLNKIAYIDDRQIDELRIKRTKSRDKQPHVVVAVYTNAP